MMAQVVLSKCCRFCAFSKPLEIYGRQVKKTKLKCEHEDNADSLKKFFGPWGTTHECGCCEHFEWGEVKKYASILGTFKNMKKEA